jgi:hypothetical protein
MRPRGGLIVLALVATTLVTRRLAADEAPVPPNVEANLTAKVAAYDRRMPARAGSVIKVLVVEKADDPASRRTAEFFADALQHVGPIGGLPHEEVRVSYAGPDALARSVREHGAAIVYLSSGLAADAPAIGNALANVSVLSVSAEPAAVVQGVVLSFDLFEAKPKLLINLTRAKAQDVDLPAGVLELAKIYR